MKPRDPAPVQRNALAPSLIAAVVLFLSPILPAGSWKLVALFATAILALIIGWFAFRARQWAWVLIFVAIAVLWNPVLPFPFSGIVWDIAQPAAALVFLAAGAVIKTRHP